MKEELIISPRAVVAIEKKMLKELFISLRLVVATMLVCVAGYSGLILGFAQMMTPDTADGSLINNKDGQVIGSRLIAQKFTAARYFWPRPSAVDYNGGGAGGSNKSPTSTDLTDRASQLIQQYGASSENPLPSELAAASGGGLDPHISEHAALYQADRVAKARGLPLSEVLSLVTSSAFSPGGFLTSTRLVNVLELNLALDLVSDELGG